MNRFKTTQYWLIFLISLIATNCFGNETADHGRLAQIRDLQTNAGIQIEGLEKLEDSEKFPTTGDLNQQIKQLFAGYNHITIRNSKGKIAKVVILNRKQKSQEQRIILPTKYQGNHFTVSADLSGDGNYWQNLEMVIDTGADLVVLPESLIGPLGLVNHAFAPAKMQTANGIAAAKIGYLKEIRISGESVENVEVAFIADQLLGNNRLLGMSFLSRYQVHIDDQNKLVTLIKK